MLMCMVRWRLRAARVEVVVVLAMTVDRMESGDLRVVLGSVDCRAQSVMMPMRRKNDPLRG